MATEDITILIYELYHVFDVDRHLQSVALEKSTDACYEQGVACKCARV
jgi:hypothetical protein